MSLLTFHMDQGIPKGVFSEAKDPWKGAAPCTNLKHTSWENDSLYDKKSHQCENELLIVFLSFPYKEHKSDIFSKTKPLLLKLSILDIFPVTTNQQKAPTRGRAKPNHINPHGGQAIGENSKDLYLMKNCPDGLVFQIQVWNLLANIHVREKTWQWVSTTHTWATQTCEEPS